MRPGRLISLAMALSVLAVSPSLARTQKRHVTVLHGRSFSLIAWDRGRSLCFGVKVGHNTGATCAADTRLAYVSLQAKGATFVGGAVRTDAASVVVTFADGKQLTVRTRRGSRYKGRSHVRFWGGRHAGVTSVRTLAAKTSRGATLQVKDVSPPPPPPPNPCGCGPPFVRVVCPLAPCPA